MHLLLEQENNSSKCKIIIFIFELFKSVINILDFHELVSRVSEKKTHVHLLSINQIFDLQCLTREELNV